MNNGQLPAYPIIGFDNDGHNSPQSYFGLSKLEIFTMAAMQGLCAMENKSDQVFSSPEEAYQLLAKHAVGIAKATLSELSKHQ